MKHWNNLIQLIILPNLDENKMKTIIEPPSFSLKAYFNFEEVKRFRDLFYFFSWRDIKVRYKQTFLGVLWTLIQPAFYAISFYFILNKHNDANYFLETFGSLCYWNLISASISNATNSFINNSNIIRKIYFPRIIIPFSAIITSAFDFIISLILFLILVLAIDPTRISIFFIIHLALGLIIAILISIGPALLLSSLTVKFRDFRYIVPFILQIGMFISPIFYKSTTIQNYYVRNLLKLNPFNLIINLFENSNHFFSTFNLVTLVNFALIAFITVTGFYVFKKSETEFADLI